MTKDELKRLTLDVIKGDITTEELYRLFDGKKASDQAMFMRKKIGRVVGYSKGYKKYLIILVPKRSGWDWIDKRETDVIPRIRDRGRTYWYIYPTNIIL